MWRVATCTILPVSAQKRWLRPLSKAAMSASVTEMVVPSMPMKHSGARLALLRLKNCTVKRSEI